MSLEHLWAGWRRTYIVEATARSGPAAHDADERRLRLLPAGRERPAVGGQPGGLAGRLTFVVMNAYPYASGHVLVLPLRHVGTLADLTAGRVGRGVVGHAAAAMATIEAAYEPDGLNMGANLGRAAGAGLPSHVHLHVLPRWSATPTS